MKGETRGDPSGGNREERRTSKDLSELRVSGRLAQGSAKQFVFFDLEGVLISNEEQGTSEWQVAAIDLSAKVMDL